LGIIVTYRHQIAAIREFLPDITIDTVERYQGSQREVIIYDVGVSRQYQLDFLTASTFTDDEGQVVDRKLNVAMTRARKQLIMTGNTALLQRNKIFSELIARYSI
jgi:superfamily I DNA and/or RNA helicase